MTAVLSPAHAALLATTPPCPGLLSESFSYEVDGLEFEGYRSFDPTAVQPRPGVLVVHDWNGVGEYVRVRCQMLARLGYVAFAPDIYGRGIRPDDSEAPALAGRFYRDPALMRARVTAGLAQLRSQPTVDVGRLAAIGYCFGGSVALALAAGGADIAGVVSFHGGLVPIDPQDAVGIKAKILVQAGSADPVVPDEAIVAWENSLRVAPEVDWQVTVYSGAMHAFTLPEAAAPDHGAAFHPIAERRSWVAMQSFFDEIFGAVS